MENYPIHHDITFGDRTHPPLTTHATNLGLAIQDDDLIECRLTLTVSPDTYQQIDAQALFNLKPEFRGPLSNGEFLPDRDLQLDITLKPDLLPQLAERGTAPEAIANYLAGLTPSDMPPQPDEVMADSTISESNSLLNSENWFCLSVKQQQEAEVTGYATFWSDVSPAFLAHTETTSEQIAEGITQWATTNLTAATQNLTEELLTGVTNLFGDFETWLDNAFSDGSDPADDVDQSGSLLDAVIAFFTNDDWTFTKLQGQTVLHMAYQGENGLWNCYAQTRETEEQFIFYSIYPDLVPEDRRSSLAELLTRLNYGLVIGNFELDLDDGEVRYKTSIDTVGSALKSQIIERLVHTNIVIMDYYWPQIKTAIGNGDEDNNALVVKASKPRLLE